MRTYEFYAIIFKESKNPKINRLNGVDILKNYEILIQNSKTALNKKSRRFLGCAKCANQFSTLGKESKSTDLLFKKL